MKLFIIFLILFTTSGCALFSDNKDNEKFYEMHVDDSMYDSSYIQTQSWNLQLTFKHAAAQLKDPTAIALLAVITGNQIAGLSASPLNVKAPTTGYDVLNKHLGTMFSATLAGVISYFSYDTIKQLAWDGGGTNNFSTEGGDINIKDSMNFVEQHQTYSSEATQTMKPSVPELWEAQ